MESNRLDDERDIIHFKANEVIIKAGQKFVVPIEVQRGNSELKYSFQTKDYNISFSIEYVNQDNKTIEVIPLCQVNSHLEAIEGSVDLPDPGEVIITWDNSFSWMTDKTLLYTIDLSMPPLIDAGLILSRLVLYHTGLDNTRGEKEILENEHKEYEENKSKIEERISEIEKELESAKNELNEVIENDNKVCETLEETIESVNKQEYQLNTYLLNSIFSLLGDEILLNLEPSDILNLGSSSNLLLPYTREIEFWETYFDSVSDDIISPVINGCQWLNDYYEGFKSGDYTHIYDNLISPAQNNENQGNEEKEREENNEKLDSININNINNKETLKREETTEQTTTTTEDDITSKPTLIAKIDAEDEEEEERKEKEKLRKSTSKDNVGIVNMEEQYILINDNEYEKCSVTKFGSNGWYKNENEDLSYIIFRSKIPKLVVGPLSTSVLRDMIERARENGYLIACPGTDQGHNGYYVNKKGNVSKWEIVNNDWKKVKLS